MASLLNRAWRRSTTGDDLLQLGLVNNMPDAALKTTERQFRELLASAAGGMPIDLKVFSISDLPRSAEGRRHVAEHHEPIEDLWGHDFDGLIVTGTVPRTDAVEEEPCWPSLALLTEWVERHTSSTIWSCLAAHAAVRHIDGIERRPLGAKLSGVYACDKSSAHRLLAAAPVRWGGPHSRYNELPEAALRARGYRILSHSAEAGADIFVKRCNSLFVFLQGHLEYDAGALYREYRRDVGRFLGGGSAVYPEMPAGYFDDGLAAAMSTFRERAEREPDSALMHAFPAFPVGEAPWRAPAVALYGSWLQQIAGRRRARRFAWSGLKLPVGGRALDPTYA